MPDDKRLDLNQDLEKISSDLLKDVKAATEEVKQRKASDAEKDRRNAAKQKDRKTSIIIIAAAAVLMVVIAYWVVFGRQPQEQATPNYTPPQTNSRVIPRPGGGALPRTPPRPGPVRPSQPNPPNEYDQPGQ